MLDNGNVKFSVSRNGDGFFQHVWLDEDRNNAFWPEEMIVHSAVRGHLFLDVIRSSGQRSGEFPRGRVHRALGTAESVKYGTGKDGDVVGVEGTFDDPGKSSYSLEMNLIAGESAIRVVHKLDFRGDMDRDLVKAWGLRVPMRYRRGPSFEKRLVTFGCDHGTEEVLAEETRWSYYAHWFIEHNHAALRQGGPTEESQTSRASGFNEHHLPEDQLPWPYWTQSGLVQESPNSYRIWKATARDVSSLPVYRGRRSAGWIDLSDETWGMTVGVKDLAKGAPAAFDVDAELDGTRGEVSVYFHPRHVAPIDLRPASKGQSRAERLKQTGLSASRTVVFYFHTDSAAASGAGEKVMELLKR